MTGRVDWRSELSRTAISEPTPGRVETQRPITAGTPRPEVVEVPDEGYHGVWGSRRELGSESPEHWVVLEREEWVGDIASNKVRQGAAFARSRVLGPCLTMGIHHLFGLLES